MAGAILALIPDEPIFDIGPFGLKAFKIEGSRGELEAEGVAPPEGSQWPEGGKCLTWNEAGTSRTLRRARPPGAKMPKKVWTHGDWWIYWCERDELPSWLERPRRSVNEELRGLARRSSPEQHELAQSQLSRYTEALGDGPFQCFKSRVPGLTPSRQGGEANSHSASR